MYGFQYHQASSVSDAAEAISRATDGSYVSGGMTLLPTMKLRLAQPSDLIDLSGVAELKGIEVQDGTVAIGAMTTHAEVADSATVQQNIVALSNLAESIGDAQVRNRGTIGGSTANNDPAADYPAGLVGLGATVQTDRREIAADDFFTGFFATALEPHELVIGIKFPIPARAGYSKFPNPASRYAVVGVMVSESGGAVRVAVTGAGASVFRVPEMEAALAANFAPAAVEGIFIPPDSLNSDLHASAEYRAHLVTIMAKRAVAAALG